MIKNKKFRIEYIILCIFAIFMITGSFSDKFISQHIVNQNSLIATFFQIFGSIAPPLILFISNSIICFYTLNQLNNKLSNTL